MGARAQEQNVHRVKRETEREHHGADPLAGSPGRHPAVLLLHPLPLQSAGHAGTPDLRRQLEVPDLHRPGRTSGSDRIQP